MANSLNPERRYLVDSDEEPMMGHSNSARPMTVNAATSSSTLGQDRLYKTIAPGSNLNPTACVYTPSDTSKDELKAITRQLNDLVTLVVDIKAKQNVLNNMMVDLKSDIEVMKRSAARFQTPGPKSTLKTTRTGFV